MGAIVLSDDTPGGEKREGHKRLAFVQGWNEMLYVIGSKGCKMARKSKARSRSMWIHWLLPVHGYNLATFLGAGGERGSHEARICARLE